MNGLIMIDLLTKLRLKRNFSTQTQYKTLPCNAITLQIDSFVQHFLFVVEKYNEIQNCQIKTKQQQLFDCLFCFISSSIYYIFCLPASKLLTMILRTITLFRQVIVLHLFIIRLHLKLLSCKLILFYEQTSLTMCLSESIKWKLSLSLSYINGVKILFLTIDYDDD